MPVQINNISVQVEQRVHVHHDYALMMHVGSILLEEVMA